MEDVAKIMEQERPNAVRAGKVFETRGLNNQDSQVLEIKTAAAFLWSLIDDISVPPGTEAGRLVSLAKTEIESSVMWAVKALSRNY